MTNWRDPEQYVPEKQTTGSVIDSLFDVVEKAEKGESSFTPLYVFGGRYRLDRLQGLPMNESAEGRAKLRSNMIVALSCYVSDELWDYCLREAQKPILRSDGK